MTNDLLRIESSDGTALVRVRTEGGKYTGHVEVTWTEGDQGANEFVVTLKPHSDDDDEFWTDDL